MPLSLLVMLSLASAAVAVSDFAKTIPISREEEVAGDEEYRLKGSYT